MAKFSPLPEIGRELSRALHSPQPAYTICLLQPEALGGGSSDAVVSLPLPYLSLPVFRWAQ